MSGGLLVLATLMAWILIGSAGNPTPAQIRDACRDHGRTVSYVPPGYFTFNSDHKVICSDGAVLRIKQ